MLIASELWGGESLPKYGPGTNLNIVATCTTRSILQPVVSDYFIFSATHCVHPEGLTEAVLDTVPARRPVPNCACC